MSGKVDQFGWVTKCARIVLVAGLVLLTIALALTVAAGSVAYVQQNHWLALYPYAIAVVVQIIAMGWLIVRFGMISLSAVAESEINNIAGRLSRIETLLDDISKSQRKQSDLASLSDQAKSLIFRDREIETMRETIHEDIMRQDYKSALSLIESMESRLGYLDEAARLRAEVETSKQGTQQEKIDAAIKRIQELIELRQWARAMREADRAAKAYPESDKAAALRNQVEAARSGHKTQLLQAYDDAVRKNNVDRSIELLQELDLYLTPQEGAALEESARGMFRAKLHNLGVQFAIRVTEKQWADAASIGEEIVLKYPNTRMAQEVRQKMDMLKARAGATASTVH